MRQGITYTACFSGLEPRQHELLGIDLGKGVVRRTLLLGALAFVVWDLSVFLTVGFPSIRWLTLYLLPPSLFTVMGAKPSKACDRRTVLAGWVIGVHYQVWGHRPVICGGRVLAHRSEWIPRSARWSRLAPALARNLGEAATARLLGGAGAESVPAAGPAVELEHTVRLYGPDHMVRVAGRGRRKGRSA
ncbi:hypothetical protein ACE1OC_41260 [Streptomyces sp. DSM 116496]|uniref:hypothetical protein n=1 Tax=Streptomyces stoeckheimensis TaxID=3344656 RepID=UPI0038B2A9A0